MPGKFFRFAYFARGPRAHGTWEPHDLRDSEAFAFVADILAARGLRYGGPILNHPPSKKVMEQLGATEDHPPLERLSVREPAWSEDDVVVLTTRPPLTDRERDRRYINRSWTTLEQRVFDTLSLFRTCSRRDITLCDTLRAKLPESERHKATAEFRMEAWKKQRHLRSAYHAFGADLPIDATHPAWGWSPVYLVSVDVNRNSWPGGPGHFLAAWGIGEVETLVFTRMLSAPPRQQLLDGRPRFFMAELELRPRTADPFASDWKLRHLLHVDPRPPHEPLDTSRPGGSP